MAIQRARIIDRANRRVEQQRKTRLELKAKLKAQTKTVTTRPPVISLTQPLARKLPTVAAEPRLTQRSFCALGFAVAAMERKDKTLSQRRLMAHHHLRQDPALSNLNPDDLV